MLGEGCEVANFHFARVEGVKRVDSDNFAASLQQTLNEVRTDEPGTTCNQDLRHCISLRSGPKVSRRNPLERSTSNLTLRRGRHRLAVAPSRALPEPKLSPGSRPPSTMLNCLHSNHNPIPNQHHWIVRYTT